MELQTSIARKFDRSRLANICAQCGETIIMPEWSEYQDPNCVRHLWECEACGYRFETLVYYPVS